MCEIFSDAADARCSPDVYLALGPGDLRSDGDLRSSRPLSDPAITRTRPCNPHMFDGATHEEAVVTYFVEKFPLVMDISSVRWTLGALAQNEPASALAFVEKYARPVSLRKIPDNECGRLLLLLTSVTI